MSIVKTVTIIDSLQTKLVKWNFTNYTENALNTSIIASQITHKLETARTNVILRGADGKFISYKNKNVEKVYRDAVESLLPFPKGV
jgi:hypothetical protein